MLRSDIDFNTQLLNASRECLRKNLNHPPDDLIRSRQSNYMTVMSLHKALVVYLSCDSQLPGPADRFAEYDKKSQEQLKVKRKDNEIHRCASIAVGCLS